MRYMMKSVQIKNRHCSRIKMFSPLVAALCFSLPSIMANAGSATVLVDSDVKITGLDGKAIKELPRNTPYTVESTEPVLFSAKGKVPVLVIPSDISNRPQIHVNLQPVLEWPPEVTQSVIDQSIEELIKSILKLQTQLSNRRPDQVLEELAGLQVKYPNVKYLNFFKANALLLQGDRTGALSALRSAMEAHPDNAEGKKLLKTLEGR